MSTYVLNELFANGLQLLYAAHHQGAAQSVASISTSSSPALRAALTEGAALNRKQAERLEKVFKTVDLAPDGRPDKAMQGIIDSNNTLVAETGNPTERDLLNIASGQIAAHFYLATYGALRGYARALGNGKAVKLLQKTMDEFGELNKELVELFDSIVSDSKERTSASSKEGNLLATTIPAFVIVGLVGAGITYAGKQVNNAEPQS